MAPRKRKCEGDGLGTRDSWVGWTGDQGFVSGGGLGTRVIEWDGFGTRDL